MKISTIKLTLAIILCAFLVTSAQAQIEKEDLAPNYSYIGSRNAEDANDIFFSKFEFKDASKVVENSKLKNNYYGTIGLSISL